MTTKPRSRSARRVARRRTLPAAFARPRRRTEQVLAESEARFRDFAAAAGDWLWETDAEDRFTWISDSVEQKLGRAPAYYIGKTRSEVAAAAAVDVESAQWKAHLEAIQRHEPFRIQRHFRRTALGEQWVSVSGVPRFDAAGRFLGYRGAVTDVTSEVQTERRAREADERLRAAIEHLGEMIVLTDAEDRIVVANRRFVEFNDAVAEYVAPGRLYEEHLRAGIARGLFPDAAGREQAWLAERMAERRNPTGPVERRRQDGRWLRVEDHRLPDGGTISFGLEITETKRAEAALRASEARFRDFARASGEWFWETDAEGRYTWFSEEVERVTGFPREWHYGKRRIDLAAAAGVDMAGEPWRSHLETLSRHEPFRDFRFVRRGPDGLRWVRSSAVPVFGADGEFLGYRGVGSDLTPIMEAEQRLKAANELLRGAVENLNESFCLCDPQDRIVLANRRFREINAPVVQHLEPGRPFEEHVRAGLALGLFPDAAGREAQWLAENLEIRRRGLGPQLFRRQDGSARLVTQQRLADGSTVTFGLDVTEQMRAEAALRQSEQRFHDMARAGGDWFWETDAAGRYTMLSQGHESISGTAPETLVGKDRIGVISQGADLGAEPWRSHLRALAAREPFRNLRYSRKGPRGIRWVNTSGAPYFGAGGEFLGYRGVGSDVTEIVQAELRARAADERLRAAIENLGESIAVTDAEDRIVVANRYFRELNGATGLATPGHLYEEHLRAGIPLGNYPDALGREAAWLQERLAARRRGGSIEVQRQDGTWLQVTDQRLPDGGMISFGLDITKRKAGERLLREMNAELERRVAERTAELKSAYQELESFSYSVSHDLRAPLRAISGFSSILREEEGERLSGEGRRYLAVIDDNARRMGKLVDALLELVRLSRRALERVPLDMAAIARGVAGDLSSEYPRARIEVGALPRASGDPTLVRQVFANLIGNALKYSCKAAEPRIEVGAERGANGTVYFVRDNGVGFDMTYGDKLFKAFERLHSEPEFHGTGIGLALAQLIVQRHGGSIQAESAPERGATFRFTLGTGSPPE